MPVSTSSKGTAFLRDRRNGLSSSAPAESLLFELAFFFFGFFGAASSSSSVPARLLAGLDDLGFFFFFFGLSGSTASPTSVSTSERARFGSASASLDRDVLPLFFFFLLEDDFLGLRSCSSADARPTLSAFERILLARLSERWRWSCLRSRCRRSPPLRPLPKSLSSNTVPPDWTLSLSLWPLAMLLARPRVVGLA